MNDDIMEEYGLILDSTQKGGYKNGTERFFTNLAAYLNGLESSKKHSCVAGVTLTGTGLKAWLTNIKRLATDETKMGSAAGRELQPAPPHISASFALMKKASLFLAERQKKPNNRYTAKPKGLDHLEPQKLMIRLLQNLLEEVLELPVRIYCCKYSARGEENKTGAT